MIEFDIAIDRWFYLIGYLHMYNRHLNLSLAYIFSLPNIRQRDASDASQQYQPYHKSLFSSLLPSRPTPAAEA